MTGLAALPHPAVRVLAGRYRQLRTAHPVRVLRWLRNGMLLGVAAAALLYVWVAIQAGHDINAARRTEQGIGYIGKAVTAAQAAGAALSHTSAAEDVTLTGIGRGYVTQVTQVEQYLALVAADNAAGTEGTSQLQFVQGQFGVYLGLSQIAIGDYSAGGYLGPAGELAASGGRGEPGGQGDLLSAFGDLKTIEQNALDAQHHAWPLDPGTFWWVLLGPVIGLLLLAGATAHVLARHFRRQAGPWLWGSLLITTATMIAVGFLNWNDEQQLAADPRAAHPVTQWAGHPVTLTGALLLLLVAAVLANLAYRPRLAEYQFKPA
jgi:hypothetical protein